MTPEHNGNPWDVLEGPSTRTPRALETREKSERQTTYRRGTLIPEVTPRDGWAYKWCVSSVNNTNAKNIFGKRLREGYEPVRIEDHPELAHETRFSDSTGVIEYGGLILCRIPLEVVEDRLRQNAEDTQSKLDHEEESYMRDPHEKAKRLFTKQRERTFGRG